MHVLSAALCGCRLCRSPRFSDCVSPHGRAGPVNAGHCQSLARGLTEIDLHNSCTYSHLRMAQILKMASVGTNSNRKLTSLISN